MDKYQKHSSISRRDNVAEYTGEECKYYYLPLFPTTLFPEVLQKGLGASNDVQRTARGVRESLIKAKRAHYSHIKFPYDRFDDRFLEWAITRSRGSGFKVVLQICTSFLYDENFYEHLLKLHSATEIEWILDDVKGPIRERLSSLDRYFAQTHISIVVHKGLRWGDLLSSRVLQMFTSIHLYFCYQMDLGDSFLACKDSHKVLGLLKKKYPMHSFLPPKGVDIWDHRARSDFDMEPFIFPCFVSSSKNPNVEFSVIIPTFNNQNHLRVVLAHLYRQSVGLDKFEVIVVDDGGTDQTQSLVMELLESFPRSMNFKYIFFERKRKRVMGDSQYRAGISRNLGVKNCQGEILCFLDSDIVVPVNYLASVESSLQTYDAVQAKRVNLSQAASSLKLDYEKVDENKDLISDEPYWEEFVNNTKDWDQLPYNWKYVCTHSFSLRKDLFWKIGGLKKNFIYYGFEDTDLGYRLVKRGYRLHLLDTRVFHMFHENTRSEFMNLKSLRHTLLSRTAQIFYLHHLDEDIYENLLGFMEPEPTFRRLLNRVVNTVSLQFLWRPGAPVYKTMTESRRLN